ncbi:MAG: S-layer protein [Calditrichales bacterium]|nr:MAG: S-layer protein [Calditrichales bacterium]
MRNLRSALELLASYRYFFICFTLFALSITTTSCAQPQNKVRMLWFDATANWERLDSEDKIAAIMDKCVAAHITDIVVDIKPNSGQLLYPTCIGPRMLEWKGVFRDSTTDYLQTMIDLARQRRLKIHAAFNVFSEGQSLVKKGLVYDRHPEWQTMLYTRDGIKQISEVSTKYSLFVNPALPDVQQYQLALLRELAGNYDLDGIILDRGRFDSIQSDFSEYSRLEFEKYLGKKIDSWPQDIYTWIPDKEKPQPGPLFKEWIFWRAMLIRNFFGQARLVIKSENPDILFGDYAGSWYPSYYELGVNWASSEYQPGYDWTHPDYHSTGYAEMLDFFCSGCYYAEVTKSDLKSARDLSAAARGEAAMDSDKQDWYCVEGACELSMEVTQGATPVLGSLYIQQYKDKPEKFIQAIDMVLAKTDGIMLFDLVHLENFEWWDVLAKTLHEK